MNLNDRLQIEQIVKIWLLFLLGNEASSCEIREEGMFSIYAFCREVDDIADSLTNSKALKEKKLGQWKKDIEKKFLKDFHWIQV